MGVHRTRVRQVYLKLEAADGTYEFPTGSDPVAADNLPEAFDIEVEPTWESRRSDVQSGTLMKRPGKVTFKTGRITFKVELKGGDAAGTAPVQSAIYKAAGCAEVIVAVTSVTYKRATSDAGYSAAVWKDGIRYGLSGCRADLSLEHTDGEQIIATITLDGKWEDPVTQAAAIGFAATTGTVPSWKGDAQLTIGAYEPILASLTFNAGNEIVVRKNANDATGLETAKLVDADPRITLDPELEDLGDKDWLADWEAKAIVALQSQVGTAGGSRYTLAAQVTPAEVGFGERDSFDTIDLEIEVVENPGDVEGDDWQIVWD